MALISSVTFLGSALGSLLGGLLLLGGLAVTDLPFAAVCVLGVAALWQLVIVLN
jgi:predicted MFS family arabinose efflux permease